MFHSHFCKRNKVCIVFKVEVNIAPYLTSDTTISPYIVPDIKEKIFFCKNPVSKLFCSLGCANRIFGGLSSRTIKGTVNDHGSDFSQFYFFALWLDNVLKLKMPKNFSQNH